MAPYMIHYCNCTRKINSGPNKINKMWSILWCFVSKRTCPDYACFAVDDNPKAVVGCTAVNAFILRTSIHSVAEKIISPDDIVNYGLKWWTSVPCDVGCWLTGHGAIQPTWLDRGRLVEINVYFWRVWNQTAFLYKQKKQQ